MVMITDDSSLSPGVGLDQASLNAPPPDGEAEQKMMPREQPDPPPARRSHVKRVLKSCQSAKAHWSARFKRMKECQDFVSSLQWSPDPKDDRYVANITQRHVATKVAALYAKNPRFVARRRPQLDFAVWDEKPATAMQAFQMIQQSMQMGVQPPPAMAELIADIQQGMTNRELHDRIARTLEILAQYTIDTQQPPLKQSMKSAVRRTIINGVGYVKLCFQRDYEPRPETAAQMADINERLATIERLNADIADGEADEDSAEVSELHAALDVLKQQPEIVSREGVFFDYPESTAIIPDPKCKAIRNFVGCDWVAQEYMLSADRIKEVYKVDIGASFTPYVCDNPNGEATPRAGAGDRKDTDMAAVYEVYSRKDNVVYVVVDGYPDFLKEPAPPEVTMERFYPWFTLVFNEVEHEKEVIPPSDVELLMPMQKEYNRSRQGLREHRHANRPMYLNSSGQLDDEDKQKLQTRPINAIIDLKGLSPGQKAEDLLQAFKPAPIDPALYDTSFVFDDMQRTVGSQEADLGGTGNATATETSIAETGRMSTMQSNTDDLDDMLTDLGVALGQVLLAEVSPDTVTEIVGPGSVWPHLTQTDIQKLITLDVQVGSSGRPNKALEMQNFQTLAPILMQIPNISPEFLAREAIKRLDDRLDLVDALAAGMPSIQTLNSIAAKGPGGLDPNAPPPAAPGAAAPAAAAPGAPGAHPAQQGPQGQAQGPVGAMNAPMPHGAGAMGPAPTGARPPVPGDNGPIRV